MHYQLTLKAYAVCKYRIHTDTKENGNRKDGCKIYSTMYTAYKVCLNLPLIFDMWYTIPGLAEHVELVGICPEQQCRKTTFLNMYKTLRKVCIVIFLPLFNRGHLLPRSLGLLCCSCSGQL